MVEQFEVEEGHAGQHQGQQVGEGASQQCFDGANVVVEQQAEGLRIIFIIIETYYFNSSSYRRL